MSTASILKNRAYIYNGTLFGQQGFNRQTVAVKTETGNHSFAGWGNHRHMAVAFPTVDIGNVHLDNRRFHCPDGIGNGYRRVGIGSGIQHNAVDIKSLTMNFVDERTFVIALEIVELNLRVTGFQRLVVALKRAVAIDAFSRTPSKFRFGPLIIKIFINLGSMSCY